MAKTHEIVIKVLCFDFMDTKSSSFTSSLSSGEELSSSNRLRLRSMDLDCPLPFKESMKTLPNLKYDPWNHMSEIYQVVRAGVLPKEKYKKTKAGQGKLKIFSSPIRA